MSDLPWLLRDVLTVALAFAAGLLSGAFSMGGQVLMKPGIRLLGVSALDTVGTTVPMILPTVASATARYVREGFVDRDAVRWAAPGGMLAAVGGSLAAPHVPGRGHLLQVATASMMFVTAVRTARGSDPRPPTADEEPAGSLPSSSPAHAGAPIALATPTTRRPRLLVVGTLAGALSGLLGVGGGVLMVPGFNQVLRMPLRVAIATSLVCAGVFAIPATITHALIGTIEWRTAMLLTLGAVPGAHVGAGMAIRASDRRLRVAVAVMIGIVAVTFATGELIAWIGG
jgi:uncharacterized membrane protein YfcA